MLVGTRQTVKNVFLAIFKFLVKLTGMETKLMTISNPETQAAAIDSAVSLLKNGEIVAFPTETVYGLGADAFNTAAVEKIFAAKNRPADNPLIVHIASYDQLESVVTKIPDTAKKLMRAFWPGPLSLVLFKQEKIPTITTGGLSTIVVRFPGHPVAQKLIAALGSPIAAPSANLSGKVSPTVALHVYEDLSGRIPLIIDDGPVEYGLESTVVDCTTEPPIILRPGSITLEQLRSVIPEIAIAEPDGPHRSPGMKYRHYSPAAPVIVFIGDPRKTAVAMEQYQFKHKEQTLGIIWHTGINPTAKLQYQLSFQPELASPKLFFALRSIDENHPDAILVQGFDQKQTGVAIMNRLKKAASTLIVV